MPIADINPNDKWVTDDQGNIKGVDSGSSRGASYFVTPATDSNGNVVGLLGPNGEEIPLKRISAALSTLGLRYWGLASLSSETSVWTVYQKQALECDFDAIQLVYYHHGASVPTGIQAIVAVTETSKTNTVDNTFEPIVGGTKYQSKDVTTDQYGWRSVTWSGAASPTVSAGTATAPSITLSDWIPLASVPRAAGEENDLPLLMLRWRVSDAAAQPWWDTGGNALWRTATADNNGRIVQVGATPADGVGTINDTNRPAGLGTTYYVPVGIRYRARKAGLSVLGIGSSLTQNNVLAADAISSWGARGCAKASDASGRPITWWNNGQSSQASSVFYASGILTAGQAKPNVIVYEAYSPNDYTTPTAGKLRYAIQNMMARAESVVEYCNTNRIACVLCTGLPHFAGLSAAADDVRKAFNVRLKAMAGDSVYVFDGDALLSNGASPADFIAGLKYDGTHPNNAGLEVLGVAFAELLNGIL